MPTRIFILCLILLGFCSISARAQSPKPAITGAIIETQLVTLEGNTPAAALNPRNDRGPVADNMQLDHLLLALKRTPEADARLAELIEAMHNPASPQYHQWLTPKELGARFGVAAQDKETVQNWLVSHGFTINHYYANAGVIDFSGNAANVREAFHTELHNLVLANGARHIANVSDPQIPAALAPAIQGMTSLHDFFPKAHSMRLGPVTFDHTSNTWHPHFNVIFQGETFHTLGPYDFATIYDLLPLWSRGFTGKGVTVAVVEDSNLANPGDWATFRATFGMDKFTQGNFRQIYPGCANPGQNGDEVEADLDAEWVSAAAPDANVELAACGDTATTFGLDRAILGLIDFEPPDIISDSYGLCETISGSAEVALENREAQLATAEGTTFFIAQGDTGADECAPVEPTDYAILGINSGDNTASAYAVDVGGTDFMAQYNSDVHGIPVSRYWSATNDPVTKQSALSYIPEIPWNDGCTSQLIFSDPVNGSFTQSYGPSGFCNSTTGQNFLIDVSGSGGPSTCFTGTPSIPGVVSGTCRGNPKPSYQSGVPGIPNDGLRDQPDLSFFASNGAWGSFLVECFSDVAQGGAPCTAQNDAILEGGGGTSFSSPAMAGIQALINQKQGRQGNANHVYYALAAQQFQQQGAAACNVSRTNGSLPAKSCVFHDITLGDMIIPCGQNPDDGKFYNCFGADPSNIGELSSSDRHAESAYGSGVGYDLATGLGSVDATNLFDAWPGR